MNIIDLKVTAYFMLSYLCFCMNCCVGLAGSLFLYVVDVIVFYLLIIIILWI